MLDEIGTVEVGKQADLVLLSADPLADIANIRKLDAVIARGRRINVDALPEQVLFYTGPPPTGAAVAVAASPTEAQADTPMPAPAVAPTQANLHDPAGTLRGRTRQRRSLEAARFRRHADRDTARHQRAHGRTQSLDFRFDHDEDQRHRARIQGVESQIASQSN